MSVMEKSKVLSLEKQRAAKNENERQLQGIPIHCQNPNCAQRRSQEAKKRELQSTYDYATWGMYNCIVSARRNWSTIQCEVCKEIIARGEYHHHAHQSPKTEHAPTQRTFSDLENLCQPTVTSSHDVDVSPELSGPPISDSGNEDNFMFCFEI